MNKIKLLRTLPLLLAVVLAAGCSDDDNGSLKNDLLKKSSGPVTVGSTLEFAYAVGSTDGSPITGVEVKANIPGGIGTGISPHEIIIDQNGGIEKGILIATETNTEGTLSAAEMVDGCTVATVRYFYVVPEEARGKTLKFSFRTLSRSSNASMESDTYQVSNMDIFTGMTMTHGENCYFSLETMQSYTKEQVETLGIADKIDLVYKYSLTMGSGWSFQHGLVSPSNDNGYLFPVELPDGVGNRTLVEKRYWPDGQLNTGSSQTVYVDEVDLRTATFDGWITACYELGGGQGALLRSHDGKYVTYLYVNTTSSNTRKITFSIKRLTMF